MSSNALIAGPPSARKSRIGPLQFVADSSVLTFLLGSDPFRERAGIDMRADSMVGLVDRVPSEAGNAPLPVGVTSPWGLFPTGGFQNIDHHCVSIRAQRARATPQAASARVAFYYRSQHGPEGGNEVVPQPA